MRRSGFALLMAVCMAASNAQAALIGTSGTVPGLRIEGTYGFIYVSSQFDGTTCDASRVWVDMTTAEGRAAYATAAIALTTEKSVAIRLDDSSLRPFGVCKLYDIYLAQ